METTGSSAGDAPLPVAQAVQAPSPSTTTSVERVASPSSAAEFYAQLAARTDDTPPPVGVESADVSSVPPAPSAAAATAAASAPLSPLPPAALDSTIPATDPAPTPVAPAASPASLPSSFSSSSSSSTLQPPSVAPVSPATSDRRSSSAEAPAPAPASNPLSLRGVPAGLKVLVNFRATGSAPIMKKTKFTLSASHRFGMVIEWLRKTLHFKPSDALFVFCNAAFAPNPDSTMYDLFHCYQVQGELVINYAIQDAWG